MKKVDKHGLKMTGLRKAAASTGNYGGNSSMYDELFYNFKTGEVWTVFQCSLGWNAWTKYHDPHIVKICNTSRHMTMQEIADYIADYLKNMSECLNLLGSETCD